MRLIYLIIFFLSFSTLQAQGIVKDFFSKDGQQVDKEGSYYYRVGKKAVMEIGPGPITKTDTVFIDTVKTFYTASDKIRSREVYQEGKRSGPFMIYHENGRLKEKGTYREGRKVGYQTNWYETGVVQKVLKYFPVPAAPPNAFVEGNYQVINYFDAGGNQLVKDGSGYCSCYLDSEKVLEKGKLVNGEKDSTWQYMINDTVRSIEKYANGKFLEGIAYRNGKEFRYTQFEASAEFPGGLQAMFNYLSKNVNYPSRAKRLGVQGKVYVKFLVDKDGTVYDVSVFKGVSDELDAEAVRVVKKMPKWSPGTQKGIPVKSQFVLPIYFNLGR